MFATGEHGTGSDTDNEAADRAGRKTTAWPSSSAVMACTSKPANEVALTDCIEDYRCMLGTVETQRLVLRPAEMTDIEFLVGLHSDPEVMRYINGGRPMLRAEVVEFLSHSIGSLWTARARSSDEFVGWFELRANEQGEYELGYRLCPSHWGVGLATEGSRALLAHGFDCLRAQRVWAQTMTVNVRSRRVLERCGLRFVRTFHTDWGGEPIPGSELGDVLYEMCRPEWLTKCGRTDG